MPPWLPDVGCKRTAVGIGPFGFRLGFCRHSHRHACSGPGVRCLAQFPNTATAPILELAKNEIVAKSTGQLDSWPLLHILGQGDQGGYGIQCVRGVQGVQGAGRKEKSRPCMQREADGYNMLYGNFLCVKFSKFLAGSGEPYIRGRRLG